MPKHILHGFVSKRSAENLFYFVLISWNQNNPATTTEEWETHLSPRGRLSFPRIKHLKQQCNVSDAHASLSLACPLILPLPLPTAPPLSQLQSIIFRLSNLYIFLNDALIPNACIICIKSHPHSSPLAPPSTLPTNNCFFPCLANLKLFVLLLSWRENKVCILDAQLDTNTHTYTFHSHAHTYTHKHTSHTHKHKEID